MIVVSGCPRSGTSLMMEIMRKTFGDDRIRGKKFPMIKEPVQDKGEPDDTFSLRQYVHGLESPKEKESFEHSKMMNPNGFWEHPFTVRGVKFSYQLKDELNEIEHEEIPSICKIVSQGIGQSDPRYISKIVYMLRDPASVAKSQENLKRSLLFKHPQTGENVNFYDGIKVTDPSMFIEVSISAALWMKDNPDIDVHFVKYMDLIQNPKETLLGVQNFLGEGDFSDGINSIEPKLNRSTGHVLEHELAEEAQYIYETMCSQSWDDIDAYILDRKTKMYASKASWRCLRSGMGVHTTLCRHCFSDRLMIKSFKGVAEKNSINWESQPCSFECAFDMTKDSHLSVNESIKNNHWIGE